MKHYAIIQADNSILVKTPNPYVVDTYKDVNPVILEDTRYKLHEACKFLWNCLAVLRIKKAEAQALDYSLNLRTGEALRSRAINSVHVSHVMRMVIANYDW